MAIDAGSRLDSYEILAPLGTGGYGRRLARACPLLPDARRRSGSLSNGSHRMQIGSLASSRRLKGERNDLAARIANATAKALEAGIVHRDLKPANLTVRPIGKLPMLVR